MKAGLLLALRTTTGLLLVIWGSIRAFSPDTALRISDKYYSGSLSVETLQMPLGLAQMALGILVVVGLFRFVVYPLQAIVLVISALAIWKYLLDPLGLFLLTEETRNVLFFPSTTVAVATLIILAFKEYDTLALDRVFKR
ncbi:hypothetical protein ABFZ85_08720 [Hyphococcus formosus]|uniref:hypothetical protein n=1 Tax=Hyphococcus formosus TaxID=3143534 RepID=UPI00398B71C3